MKTKTMIATALLTAGLGIGAACAPANPARAEAVYSWVRGTWHNKHYIFKITKRTVKTKNRYTGAYKKYRIQQFLGTHDVCYIYTSHGYNKGFAVEGIGNNLYIGKLHGPASSGHMSQFYK